MTVSCRIMPHSMKYKWKSIRVNQHIGNNSVYFPRIVPVAQDRRAATDRLLLHPAAPRCASVPVQFIPKVWLAAPEHKHATFSALLGLTHAQST